MKTIRFFKVICLLLCGVGLLNLFGCTKAHLKNEDLNGKWVGFDQKTGSEIFAEFDGEKSVVFGDQSHEFDFSYSYDPNKKILLLTDDSKKTDIRVIYLDEDALLLFCEDSVYGFKNSESREGEKVRGSAAQYVDNPHFPQLSVLGLSEKGLCVAPYCYDGDAKADFQQYITYIPVCDDAEYISVSVFVENGEEEVTALKLTDSDKKNIGEFYTSGFLSFDSEGKVSKVVFYGETVVF